MNINKIHKKLEKYNQEHLLYFEKSLNEQEKESLYKELFEIDYEEVKNMFNYKETLNSKDEISPLNGKDKNMFLKDDVERISCIGEKIIASNKYAVITMAGGQGTRLGHSGPKGTLKLKLNDGDKYIFELLTLKLIAANKKYGVYIPWYIMTSMENNDDTVRFFKENNYFNYPEEKVKFFVQSELPITDMNGNLLLKTKNHVLKASDGNGGVFNAIYKNNIIGDLKRNNIEWILITGVDNILVNFTDEFYIGLVQSENKLNGVKAISKKCPEEKVGVFCKRNGKVSVIEYSEMTDEMLYLKDENCKLQYDQANIVNHLLNIELLEKIVKEKLPIHKAVKKMDYIAKNGNLVKADKASVIKYETFIFDYFNKVDDVTIYKVLREEEFAPIKNKSGEDSPISAIKAYNNFVKLKGTYEKN